MLKACRVLRCTAEKKNLEGPFPTDGGSVPIWAMAGGRIQKYNWIVKNPKWCDLCKEPISLWVDHAGRKDHALMDLHYRQYVEFPRSWNPAQVLGSFATELGAPVSIGRYHKKAAYYDQRRRSEIFAMVNYLSDEGVISLGHPRNTFLYRCQGGMRGLDHQGALVLHEYMLPTFLRLYPEGHIQDFSNLVDFISCGYNMETVYDVCAFYELDRIGETKLKASSPAALGLGGIASSSSASSGFDSSAGEAPLDASKADSEEEYEAAFSRKAQFMRSMLGQLRWTTQRESKDHPQGKKFAPHLVHIADNLAKLLVCEIVVCRIIEYMVRVEPVWLENGMERRKLDMKRVEKEIRPAPRPITSFFRKMEGNLNDYYVLPKSAKQKELDKQRREEEALLMAAASAAAKGAMGAQPAVSTTGGLASLSAGATEKKKAVTSEKGQVKPVRYMPRLKSQPKFPGERPML